MHVAITNNLFITGSLIGYSVGLVITTLLVVLTMRAYNVPGTPRANIQCALFALLWNLGGLAHAVTSTLGSPIAGRLALFALAVQFTGAAAFPVPMLSIWRPLAVQRWQRISSRVLQILALISAGAIVFGLWLSAISGSNFHQELTLREITSFNGSALLIAAAALLLRRNMISRTTRFALLTILLSVLATSLGIVVKETFPLSENLIAVLIVISEQSTLFTVLGAFFLFARFRFADVFIRYSVRIMLASLLAVLLVTVLRSSSLGHLVGLAKFPAAIHVFTASALTAVSFLSFVFVDRRGELLVSRWIFHAPDYRKAARQFGETLTHLHDESEIASTAEQAIRITLELDDVCLIGFDTLPETKWPDELREGEVVELDTSSVLREMLLLPNLELLIPVRSAGHVARAVAVSPGPIRRGLVSEEINFLQTVAAHIGARFDTLSLEREAIEQRSREALLLQQVTEAELRALRAQINPHFLFNSLNTIANLIVANPAAAETMTLRLARVFRYVLAHSSHAMTSIHEEIEFLRTYLEIEEARFGDRLKVEIDIAPEAAAEHIPSLILQPIVENALKHGLSPKLGPGYLRISAQLMGDQVCLEVEDDGIGPEWATSRKGNGSHASFSKPGNGKRSSAMGLRNITERLATLYRDRAHVNLEPRERGGTRVTLLVPRSHGGKGS